MRILSCALVDRLRRHSSLCRAKDARPGALQIQADPSQEPDQGFSFTKLLGLDEEQQQRGAGVLQLAPLGGMAPPAEPPQPPWRRMVAPPGVKPLPPAPGKVCLGNLPLLDVETQLTFGNIF